MLVLVVGLGWLTRTESQDTRKIYWLYPLRGARQAGLDPGLLCDFVTAYKSGAERQWVKSVKHFSSWDSRLLDQTFREKDAIDVAEWW